MIALSWSDSEDPRIYLYSKIIFLDVQLENISLEIKTAEIEQIHRRGVEPLPLAWKASMITASPSVSKM